MIIFNDEQTQETRNIQNFITSDNQLHDGGFWDNASANFDLAYNEERFFSYSNNLTDNGFDEDSRTNTINVMYQITGDEKYNLSGGYGPFAKEKLLQDLANDEEGMKLLTQYLTENPDAEIGDYPTVMEIIRRQHDERKQRVEDAARRTPGDWSRFLGTFAGAGAGAILDPVLIPGLFVGAGEARILHLIGKVAGVTFTEEAFIQGNVADFKKVLGEDYDRWLNTVIATGFASAIPIIGRVVSRGWRGGKNALGKNLTDDQVNLKNEVEMSAKATVADRYELWRGAELLRDTGRITDGKLNLHAGKEINTTGIKSKYIKKLNVGNSAAKVSTMKAQLGTEVTNKVLRQAEKLNKSLDDLDVDDIIMLRNQKEGGHKPDLEAVTEFKAEARRLMEEGNKPKVNESAMDVDDVDLDLPEFDEIFEGSGGKTTREVVQSADKELAELKGEQACYYTSIRLRRNYGSL